MSLSYRFSLRALLVVVAVCGVGSLWLRRSVLPRPYTGHIYAWSVGSYQDDGLDAEFTTRLTDDAAAESPTWNPADPNPPLSARAALGIADKVRKEKLRDKDGWKWGLDTIELKPLDPAKNTWCWSVVFVAYPNGGLGGEAPRVHVIVLMNGKVIEPEVRARDLLKEWGLISDDEKNCGQ
jgi:hypothetical protein